MNKNKKCSLFFYLMCVLAVSMMAASHVLYAQDAKGKEPKSAQQSIKETPEKKPKKKKTMQLTPVSFSKLPRWEKDDHFLAFSAFKQSCKRYVKRFEEEDLKIIDEKRLKLCLLAVSEKIYTNSHAKIFFEKHFAPFKVTPVPAKSLLTGYFEPVLEGSRKKSKIYYVPVYKRPDDLISNIDDTKRAAHNHEISAGRMVDGKLVPYFTRQEIEQGALKKQKLELIYLKDPVDTFFMHVQGSARIRLEDGSMIRIGYDGKNGHPYSSIGRHMLEDHGVEPKVLSMSGIKKWLNADKKRGAKVMWHNKSFIFFRELEQGQDQDGPIGAEGVPLTSGRSLAVDGSYHQLGLPIYVVAPKIDHFGGDGFYRLMVAQDVGSAIKGQVRGDIYWGSGDEAGKIAGTTKQPGEFYVLQMK